MNFGSERNNNRIVAHGFDPCNMYDSYEHCSRFFRSVQVFVDRISVGLYRSYYWVPLAIRYVVPNSDNHPYPVPYDKITFNVVHRFTTPIEGTTDRKKGYWEKTPWYRTQCGGKCVIRYVMHL